MEATTVRIPLKAHRALTNGLHRRQGLKVHTIYAALIRAYLANPSIINQYLVDSEEDEAGAVA